MGLVRVSRKGSPLFMKYNHKFTCMLINLVKIHCHVHCLYMYFAYKYIYIYMYIYIYLVQHCIKLLMY